MLVDALGQIVLANPYALLAPVFGAFIGVAFAATVGGALVERVRS